MTAKNVLMRP